MPEEEHQRVLTTAVDVPEQSPSFPLELSEVGISGKTVWVNLPQGRIPFTCQVVLDLPARIRGIHMSRIEEAVAAADARAFADLRLYALALGRQVLEKQRGSVVQVALHGRYPVIRSTPVSKKQSVDTVEIEALATVRRQGAQLRETVLVGVELCHITMCPCTQAYNRVLFRRSDEEFALPSHSQRSRTRLVMSDDQGQPAYDELIACLESSLHVGLDLLKRSDEAELVLQAQRRPQFAEDAVRETARSVGMMFAHRLPASTSVLIESLSLESIHIHDVRCKVQTSLGAIRESMDNGS